MDHPLIKNTYRIVFNTEFVPEAINRNLKSEDMVKYYSGPK